MCWSRIMEANLVFEGPTGRNHHPKSHFARSIAGCDHGGRQKVRSWLRGFCGRDRGANETKFNLRSELERQGHQVRESRPEQGQRSRSRGGGETATRVRSFGLYDDLNYKVREIPRRREFSCDLFLKWRQSNPSRQFCGPGPPRCPPHSGNSCIGGTSSRRVSCGMIRMTGRRTTRSRRCHPYHLQSKGE
jgi:hypothetical protein